MPVRLAFPSPIGVFLRQWFLIIALAVIGTDASRAQSTFSMEQIDALTAPIALYPDTLLAQVMIASTYPAEVAQAAQWAQQNSSLSGAALDSALQQQPWDASVKALVQTPSVLQQMNSKLDWTQQLGDAVLAQQADVMDSVQRLRQRAQNAGNLMTTEQQTVVTQPATAPGGQQTIVIEQANPQVLYVPSYEPQVVYGGWPYPSYPPYSWPAPVGYGYPGYAFGSGLVWGAGFAIGAAAWGNAFDWGGGDINVNYNRNDFTNINNNRANTISNNRQSWQHNAENRRGSNYRDTATREKFGKSNAAGVDSRRESRGFDQGQRGNQGQLGNRGGQGQLGQGQRPSQGQLSQQLGQRSGQGQLGQGQRPSQGQLSQQLGQRSGQGQLGQGQRPNQAQLSQQLGQRGGQGQFGQSRSNMERRGQVSGFEGANNGARARQASARGSSSRQMMAQNASARGGGAGVNRGGGAARPQVNRGGGARPQVNRGGGGGRAAGGGGRGGGGRRR
jgi:hypothetical protein